MQAFPYPGQDLPPFPGACLTQQRRARVPGAVAALEEPAADENALVVGVEGEPAAIVEMIVQRL